MSKPRLFIGSSQNNLRVARVLAEGLEDSAEVTIWNEGVFGLNKGFLETLLVNLVKYDFAVFILAPDDLTTSKNVITPSPRDNVLFESGLFMGLLGRDRVFLVYDQSVKLKIPSDLAGVTLASYDGTRIKGSDAEAAMRKACRLISDIIRDSRFQHLVGEWQSIYPMTFEQGDPLVDEVVEIRARRDGISIISKFSAKNDYYEAFGRFPIERQIIGEWKSREESDDMRGVFVLTVSPKAKFMYGYFTSPDETGGLSYASWILVKKAGTGEAERRKRLKTARDMLTRRTIGLSPQVSNQTRMKRQRSKDANRA